MGCILIDSVNIKIQFIKRFAKVTAVGVAVCGCMSIQHSCYRIIARKHRATAAISSTLLFLWKSGLTCSLYKPLHVYEKYADFRAEPQGQLL